MILRQSGLVAQGNNPFSEGSGVGLESPTPEALCLQGPCAISDNERKWKRKEKFAGSILTLGTLNIIF